MNQTKHPVAIAEAIEPGTLTIDERPLGSTIQWHDGHRWRVLWGHGSVASAERAAREFAEFRNTASQYVVRELIEGLRASIERSSIIDKVSAEEVYRLIGETLKSLMAPEPKPPKSNLVDPHGRTADGS